METRPKPPNNANFPVDTLREATDQFAANFSLNGDGGGDSTTSSSGSGRNVEISDVVRRQYDRPPDINFAPKINPSDENALSEGTPVERYPLRYRFASGTADRWNVTHRLHKETTIAGMTRNIETVSKIIRRWEYSPQPDDQPGETSDLDTDTPFTTEYFIEMMKLQQMEEGADPVLYDSRVDTRVPEEFSVFGTEKTVGPALERFRIDSVGLMTDKEKLIPEFHGTEQDSRVPVPFPAEPVAVGETWTLPQTIYLKTRDETIKTVKAVRKFTLESVVGEVAVIRLSVTLLSIIGDAYLDGQLAEKLYTGTCRFDIPRGKALRTELLFDRSVPGAFGDATILVYRCQITEEIVPE